MFVYYLAFPQDPVVYISLDDAFASMMQFMTISSRKCGVSVAYQFLNNDHYVNLGLNIEGGFGPLYIML